jgi:hypothetical protein
VLRTPKKREVSKTRCTGELERLLAITECDERAAGSSHAPVFATLTIT